jgi:hypothetical protein
MAYAVKDEHMYLGLPDEGFTEDLDEALRFASKRQARLAAGRLCCKGLDAVVVRLVPRAKA